MYKRKLDLTVYVPDGKYCNMGPKKNCRFCCKHVNGHTCALNQEQLEHDGRYIIKTQECMWLSPVPIVHTDLQTNLSIKDVFEEAGSFFIKNYKMLRADGVPEEAALNLARKMLNNSEEVNR